MPVETINGTRLFYELTGEGPPLVLIHGSWGDHNNWGAVVPRLAESFTVLSYDRRGHSPSEAPSGQGSVNDDSADLAALVNSLDLSPAHIVGNSFGASIVLRVAGRYPEIFRSLAVHEPPLLDFLAAGSEFEEASRTASEAIGPVLQLLHNGNNREAAQLFAETVAIGPGGWERMPEAARETWIKNAPTFLDESRDPEMATCDLAPLSGFPHPALLSYGLQSAPFFPAIVAKVAQAMPQAQVYVYEDAGHVPHVSHPDKYVQTLTSFLATVAC